MMVIGRITQLPFKPSIVETEWTNQLLLEPPMVGKEGANPLPLEELVICRFQDQQMGFSQQDTLGIYFVTVLWKNVEDFKRNSFRLYLEN